MENTAKIRGFKMGDYRFELDENTLGKPVARMYKMAHAGYFKGHYKYVVGHYFNDEARREEWIKERIAAIESVKKDKIDRKSAKAAARANMVNPFKVGDLLYDSWGYDQTNIDFYEIVEVKPKSVVIREIGAVTVPGSEGMMSSRVKPNPGHYVGEPMLKPLVVSVGRDGKNPSYHISSRHGWISKYDKGERGVYNSWYH